MPKIARLRLEELDARITPAAGSLDASFGQNGIAYLGEKDTDTSASERLVLQADGKIISVGMIRSSSSYAELPSFFRYNADGSPDTSFSGDGIASFNLHDGSGRFYAAALQPDGKIVATGSAEISGKNQALLMRVNSDGTPDKSFGVNGVAKPIALDENSTSLALQSDGKIVIAGYTQDEPRFPKRVLMARRYNIDGTLDTTFGVAGTAKVRVDEYGGDEVEQSVLIQPDGKIVLSGNYYHGFARARFNTNGSLDRTYGNSGFVTDLPAGLQQGIISDAVMLRDGKILAAGTGMISSDPIFGHPFLMRYNTDGSLDTTFDNDGLLVQDLPTNGGEYDCIALKANGGFVVGGTYAVTGKGPVVIAARYNADGTLDTSFGPSDTKVIPGIVQTDIGGNYFAIAVQDNGDILASGLGGYSTGVIVRYRGSAGYPLAVDDAYSVDQDRVLTVSVTGILSNDEFPKESPTTINVIQQPTHGTMQIQPDGSFVYIPDAGYQGADKFQYQLDNGNVSNIASVTIAVDKPGNDVYSVNDHYSVDEDKVLAVGSSGILENDQFPVGCAATIKIVTQPTHGSLELQQDGSFVYAPHTNYHGTDSFTYQIDNGIAGNIATVGLTINSVNDAPVTVRDEYVIPGNGNLVVPANLGVLKNDIDVDGDSLRAVLVTPPVKGTLKFLGNGSFTYHGQRA